MARRAKNPIEDNSKEVVVRKREIQHYSGIIPHPSIVEGYEKVCPGAADRILAMTENDLKHKQELENKEQDSIIKCRNIALNSEISSFKRGQYFGFIIMMIAIIGGIYLLSIGKTIGGFVSLVGSIFFYFSAVMYRKKIEKQSKNIEKEEV